MQVGHEGEFGLGAGFPAEVERGHEVAEVFAVEDHAVEDAVYEGSEPIQTLLNPRLHTLGIQDQYLVLHRLVSDSDHLILLCF